MIGDPDERKLLVFDRSENFLWLSVPAFREHTLAEWNKFLRGWF